MNMIKKLSVIALTLSCAYLAGCVQPPRPTIAPQPEPFNNSPHTPVDSTQVQLAEAAATVSQSLISLAQIQQAATPAKRPLAPPIPSSYGMGEKVSINWYGPVGPLVAKISELTHYNLRVLGTPPAIPIVVTISEKDIPIGTILQNAGYQSGKRADIIVYPSTKVIELRYAKA